MYFQCAILLPRLYGRPGLRQLACAFPTQPCAGPLLQRALQAEPDNLLCGTRRLGGRPAGWNKRTGRCAQREEHSCMDRLLGEGRKPRLGMVAKTDCLFL